jgi:hypothetical protein
MGRAAAYDELITKGNVGPLLKNELIHRVLDDVKNGTGSLITSASQVGGFPTQIETDPGDPVNSPPSIAPVEDQFLTISKDENGDKICLWPTGPIQLDIVDPENDQLTISHVSSNSQVLDASNVEIIEPDYILDLFKNPNPIEGEAIITVTVSDGELSASTAIRFVFEEEAENQAPVIEPIPDQVFTINLDGSVTAPPIDVSVFDPDEDDLFITLSSDNQSVIDDGDIYFEGNQISILSEPSEAGSANVTISADDGDLSTGQSFLVTYVMQPEPPIDLEDRVALLEERVARLESEKLEVSISGTFDVTKKSEE